MEIKNQKNEEDGYYIENTQAFKDLKIGKFDTTWETFLADGWEKERLNDREDINYFTDGTFHYLSRIPVEVIDKDKEHWPVTYRYNMNWYRSDTFKKDHDGLHVLFAGCSNTEGVGQDIEKTWSYLLYTELSKDYKLSGYFNIGKGGYGWQKIISATMNYINEYGKPDVLFINHPNLIRDYYWVPSQNSWIFTQKLPYEKAHAGKKNWNNVRENDQYEEIDFYRWPTLDDIRNYFPGWAVAWFTFLEYCRAMGIKVLWTTWDYQEGTNIKNMDIFKGTFFENQNIYPQWIEEKRPGGKVIDGDLNARDGHPGYLVHLKWTEEFIKAIKEKGILNEFHKKYA
jgi:hypothetical protein